MPASFRWCDGKAPERWQAGRLSSDGNAASVPPGRRWRRLGSVNVAPERCVTVTSMSLPRRLAVGASAVVLALAVTACSGDEGASGNEKADADDSGEVSPEEVMAYAKELLDGTSGVEISLATDDEPDRDAFLKSATGTIIADPPAFEGSADGRYMGFDASDIAIVSVDGDFYVDLPIRGFDKLDPAELCAPDPAELLDPDSGVSSVLTAAEDLEQGDSERGGPDNEEVLTVYTGTVPGEAIKNVLPCAPGRVLRRQAHHQRGRVPARRRGDRPVLRGRRAGDHVHDRRRGVRRREGDLGALRYGILLP